MRITIAIDDDVAFGIDQIQNAEPEKPFSILVNEILRKGLRSATEEKGNARFKVKPLDLGLREDLNFDKIEEVLDELDGVHRR